MPRIYSEERGGGYPLLLIPGWTLNLHIWDDLAPYLENDFELILPDLRGTGRSPSEGLQSSIENDALDLAKVMAGRRNFSVIAHSRGVKVFLALEKLMPGSACEGVLLGSAGFGAVNDRFDAEFEKLRALAENKGLEEAVRHIPEAIKLGPVAGGIESVRRIKSAMIGYEGRDLVQKDPPRRRGYGEFYRGMDIPLAFVAGENDPLLADVVEAEKLYDKGELHIMKGIGHFPMIEAPGALAKIILDFMKGN